MDVNVNGPFYLIYYLAPRMQKHGGGRVINISSNAALMPQFGRVSYTTTKRALEGMTEALAHDLRERVAVNCLRIDLPVWSEGFAETLDGPSVGFEDAVICSDAILWLANEPLAHSGEIHTMTELREQGVVRPKSPARAGRTRPTEES